MPNFRPMPLAPNVPTGRAEEVRSQAAPRDARLATDRLVDRPVVRDAVRQAMAESLTHEAHSRVARARRGSAALYGVQPAHDARADAAHDGSAATLAQLLGDVRTVVACYVHERRAAGVPVERVLVAVKALVREARAIERWDDPDGALMAQVVGWTIASYFDTASDATEAADAHHGA